jgi:hypothetical protein
MSQQQFRLSNVTMSALILYTAGVQVRSSIKKKVKRIAWMVGVVNEDSEACDLDCAFMSVAGLT